MVDGAFDAIERGASPVLVEFVPGKAAGCGIGGADTDCVRAQCLADLAELDAEPEACL